MATRFSLASITLLIVFVFLAQDAEAEPPGLYDFMKLGVRWAKSYCDSDRIMNSRSRCEQIPQIFIVHGFWPMYWVHKYGAIDGYDDMYVPAFNLVNNSGCADVMPVSETSITRATLKSIWDDMIWYWPSIMHPKGALRNWKTMWSRHGMCAKTPTDPLTYFRTAINFTKTHDFLAILAKDEIVPDNENLYNIHDISEAITKSVLVKPQIRCTTMHIQNKRVVQFSELFFCFNREGGRMRCNAGFYECPDIDETQPNVKYWVRFPQ